MREEEGPSAVGSFTLLWDTTCDVPGSDDAASAALGGFVTMLVPALRALPRIIVLRRLSATAQLCELRFE